MTKIEWTEQTWNPIVGCSIVSPGCTNCYAMRMAARLEAMGVPHYVGTTKRVNGNPVWTGKLALASERILTEPLRRRKPTMYFVNSMSDLFHESVPDEWVDRVFAVMALCAGASDAHAASARHPQHTFQVLTKRSSRMRAYLDKLKRRISDGETNFACDVMGHCEGIAYFNRVPWPLPNVWLGVSAERQQEADARIPDLLATAAAVRFVSAEPLLGPISFKRVTVASKGWQDALSGWRECADYPGREKTLDWIIVGGESGPGARPMHPDWPRSIRDQCQAAGVPFFFKQWGAWLPSNDQVNFADGQEWSERHFPGRPFEQHSSGHTFVNVGKSRAGRVLDGREWNGMPPQVETDPSACRPSRPAPRRGVARANQQ